ncbi:MAG TPA: recombinase family protein [Ktedonobacterales bacterium]|nr:recombinase family protein [Ktedonobacterales bacterium]
MRTAIYCRVSTPGQKNTTSLPEQERINREHTASLGWEVSELHVYHEVEGGEDLYRPHMDRLWDAIQAREIDAVVIDVLDRLSRDEGDQGAVYHHADRYGVTIELASQDYDETEQGRTMRFIAGLHARMEHADIRRRTQRGRKARVASGKMLTPPWPLYGYLWGDPKKGERTYYIIDPETGPVVVLIFDWAANGMSIHQIARRLEADGIPTPSQVLAARGQLPTGRTVSAVWHRSTLQRLLRHPAYWGEHCAYRFAHTKEKVRPAETGISRKVHRIVERDTDDPVRVALPAGVCPALVSRELAARVRARLRENKVENAGRNRDPLATLWRGMGICGHCGQKLYTDMGSDGRRYYCRTHRMSPHALAQNGLSAPCPSRGASITAHALDRDGWADVYMWLSKPENVERLFADWHAKKRGSARTITSRLDAAADQIAYLRDKMARLGETIAETSERESRRTLQATLDHYARQVCAEEGKREQLLQEAHDAADQAQQERDIREWVRDVREHAADYGPAERRVTLKALGAVVTVWREDHVQEDGKPGRYRIKLGFTGFTGQPVTLPAHDASLHPDPLNL